MGICGSGGYEEGRQASMQTSFFFGLSLAEDMHLPELTQSSASPPQSQQQELQQHQPQMHEQQPRGHPQKQQVQNQPLETSGVCTVNCKSLVMCK